MKVFLFGKASKNIQELVKGLGFEIVSKNPEVIITYGGDGTLLSSERHYPAIPKLPIRNDAICNKCLEHKTDVVLKNLLKNSLRLKEYPKLETKVENQTLLALNDFVIRNSSPIHAIRFKMTIPSHPELDSGSMLLIGDGVVVSTPFGSTGYFKSVTGQNFEKGFGLAFNNTTEKTPPIFSKDEDTVRFKLVRGKATLSFDNSPEVFTVDESSELIFKLSDQIAKIYELESLRCPNCEVIRG